MEFREYLEKTYASWLGKTIGVRMGAPIENWTYEDIKKTYGHINDYPLDYGVFAADDDTNGPLFFVRSLLEDADEDIDIEKMADAILGYISDGHGFFWWGGKGISTEDTSYHNLKDGMSANLSGKAITNTRAIAEQIGGQIFSDCWGYVSYGRPEVAKKLAAKMSSITHDLDGINGGIFVAVMISLAYQYNDARVIIEKALEYLDGESNYKKCVEDVIAIYDSGLSLEAARQLILDKYSYAKYEGVCHIIPNTAMMIWSMLYGENDFTKTLCILCESGWDTDCNAGNVGSIMGLICGIEGIDNKWIKPINDLLLASSSIGSLNIETISNSALRFAKIGAKLNNVEVLDYIDNHYYFDLPYASQALVAQPYRYADLKLVNVDDNLNVVIQGFKGYKNYITKKTYYRPEDVYDARYEPNFSPLIMCGSEVGFKLSGSKDITLRIYTKDRNDNYYYGDYFKLDEEARWYTFKINGEKDATYIEFGLEVNLDQRILHDVFKIHEMLINPKYDYVIDFSKECLEDWGLSFGETKLYELSQLSTDNKKAYYTSDGLVLNGDTVTFGNVYGTLKYAEFNATINELTELEFRFDVKSNVIYTGVKFSDDSVIVYRKNGRNSENILFKTKNNKISNDFTLILLIENEIITLGYLDNHFEIPYKYDRMGALSISSSQGSDCIIKGCKLESF